MFSSSVDFSQLASVVAEDEAEVDVVEEDVVEAVAATVVAEEVSLATAILLDLHFTFTLTRFLVSNTGYGGGGSRYGGGGYGDGY